MTNKEKYAVFCDKTYVPVFSKPWWMDSVCGSENWDVWLFESGSGEVFAAMPYYMETRGKYRYITKAPLTRDNGIIFRYPEGQKHPARAGFQEHIINAACDFIESMGLDVYEQQFHYSLDNWLPFLWRGFSALPRYTCVIADTSDIGAVWNNMSPGYRQNIRKAKNFVTVSEGFDPYRFYDEHVKVFKRQELPCPFSKELWLKLYSAAKEHNSGKIILAKTPEDDIASVLYLVWDEQSAYLLLGGAMPGYSRLQSYDLLIFEAIKLASQMGLRFDFEGSVIRRIFRSYMNFGTEQAPYFRIRKVFSPEIIRREAEDCIIRLASEKGQQ